MIKTLLSLLFIVFLAWLSIDYFSITLPTAEPTRERNKHKESSAREVRSQTITSRTIIQKERITLVQLLEDNLFYDAMAFYLENSTQENRKQIEDYLAILAKSNPTLALEYMQIFLDDVPESTIWKLMIKTHIDQANFVKAIELIILAKENYVSESEEKRLSTQLRDVTISYIDVLIQRKEYAKLILFLEEMIAYDDTDNFYKFRLAQLYMRLDKVDEAGLLLEGLQYDEVYAQNVKTLLNSIDKSEEEQYKYAIPLEKYGDHYIANIFLDGVVFKLMLDTGATYIFIDEDKASMLEVIRDDLVLQTVGGDVHAKLCHVNNLEVGNLSLSHIDVTIAPFKREGIDGLLGMNFFRQFSFIISQDEDILYLNPKSL